MVKTVGLDNYSDVYYAPDDIAHKIVAHFSPKGKCLEPFCGNNAFLKFLPERSDWCEIAKDRNFFHFNEPIDWIMTNPPFSNLTEVFEHSFKISNNCVFLLPISKYWSSNPRLKLAKQYGGLKEILHVGTGREIGFDIGFPFGALHFAKGYSGRIRESHLIK